MMSRMVLCGGVLSARQPRASGREVFFSKSRLSLQKWLLLIHFWVKEYPVKDAASDIEVDKNTAVDVYRWLREVCSTKLLATPIILGGPGVIVQVDESLYRHKPKVIHTLHTLLYKFLPIILIFSVSLWSINQHRGNTMGIRNGRYILFTSTWVRAAGRSEGCCNTSTHYSESCCPGYDYTF